MGWDKRKAEPSKCKHGRMKVWRNKPLKCPDCWREMQNLIDWGGDKAAEADDRSGDRKQRTAKFHLNKER